MPCLNGSACIGQRPAPFFAPKRGNEKKKNTPPLFFLLYCVWSRVFSTVFWGCGHLCERREHIVCAWDSSWLDCGIPADWQGFLIIDLCRKKLPLAYPGPFSLVSCYALSFSLLALPASVSGLLQRARQVWNHVTPVLLCRWRESDPLRLGGGRGKREEGADRCLGCVVIQAWHSALLPVVFLTPVIHFRIFLGLDWGGRIHLACPPPSQARRASAPFSKPSSPICRTRVETVDDEGIDSREEANPPLFPNSLSLAFFFLLWAVDRDTRAPPMHHLHSLAEEATPVLVPPSNSRGIWCSYPTLFTICFCLWYTLVYPALCKTE